MFGVVLKNRSAQGGIGPAPKKVPHDPTGGKRTLLHPGNSMIPKEETMCIFNSSLIVVLLSLLKG